MDDIETLGDLWDATPLERELFEELAEYREREDAYTLEEVLRDEQLYFARETLECLGDLADNIDNMRVAEIRRTIKDIMDNNRAEF